MYTKSHSEAVAIAEQLASDGISFSFTPIKNKFEFDFDISQAPWLYCEDQELKFKCDVDEYDDMEFDDYDYDEYLDSE